MTYPAGLFFNNKRDKAPDFVLGSISIKIDVFTEWLKTQQPNEYGYLRFDVLKGKDGKPYVKLDEYKKDAVKPEEARAAIMEGMSDDEINTDDIPF